MKISRKLNSRKINKEIDKIDDKIRWYKYKLEKLEDKKLDLIFDLQNCEIEEDIQLLFAYDLGVDPYENDD